MDSSAVAFGDGGSWERVREGEEARVAQQVGCRRQTLPSEGHGDATAASGATMAAEVVD